MTDVGWTLTGLLPALAGVVYAVYRWRVVAAVVRDVWPARSEADRRTARLLDAHGRGGPDEPDVASRLNDALRRPPAPPPTP